VPILKAGETSDRPEKLIEELRAEMTLLAEQLEFEEAARVRDKIRAMEQAGDAGDMAIAAPAPKKARKAQRARR
jgi:protein-arginine kinase activator protein McsA